MVRFGNSLTEHADTYSGMIDTTKYLNYEKLKDLLYNEPGSFLDQFVAEVRKLEDFLRNHDDGKQHCQEGCPCRVPEVQAKMKFLRMNREGCRKILKKYDKETGSMESKPYMEMVDRLLINSFNEEECAEIETGGWMERTIAPTGPTKSKPDLESQPKQEQQVLNIPQPFSSYLPSPVSESARLKKVQQSQEATPSQPVQSDDQPHIKWHELCGLRIGYLHRQVKTHTADGQTTVLVGNKEIYRTDSCLIHDPQNKGRYLVPLILIEDTVGKTDYRVKKQSFVCMLFQKGGKAGHRGCNAHNACNQLHVSRDAITKLREMASVGGGYTVTTGTNFVVELRNVFDPHSNMKYVLPFHRTEPTMGRALYSREAENYSPVLCLRYLDGTCKSGRKCRQIHVDPPFIAKLRYGSPCCPFHDPERVSAPGDGVTIRIRWGSKQAGQAMEIPTKYVTDTSGLRSLPVKNSGGGGSVICFASGKICRLHRENRCEYGVKCNNIHVCQSAFQLSQHTPPATSVKQQQLSKKVEVTHSPYATNPPLPAPTSIASFYPHNPQQPLPNPTAAAVLTSPSPISPNPNFRTEVFNFLASAVETPMHPIYQQDAVTPAFTVP